MRDRNTRLAAFFTLACGALCVLCAQPENPASWKTGPGPAGGSVASLVDDGTDLYAGLSQSGVFRLAGKTGAWQPVQDGLGSRSVRALALLSEGLFAATDSGLFRLSQNRKSWSPVSGTPRTTCYSLFSDGSLALAGTDTGVLRSADSGKTWTAVAVGEYPYVFALARLGRFLYAGSEVGHGVYRSADEGLSWTQIVTGLPLDDGMSVYALIGHPVSGQAGKIFAATTAGLYVSADSGTQWAEVTQGLPNEGQFTALSRSGSLLYAGTHGNGVFQSADGGAAWTAVPGLRSRAIVNALLPVDSDVWAGTLRDGVLRRKAAGSVWEDMNAGLTGVAPTALACNQNLMAAAWKDKVYVSRDGGATWPVFHLWDDEPEAVSVAVWQDRLYLGTENGLWDADLQAASPALRKLQAYAVHALTPWEDSLLVLSDEGLWQWHPGAASPVLTGIATQDFTILDAGSRWLHGFTRYGSYGEYAAEKNSWTLFDAPQMEPQSLITLDSTPVLATESLETYALRREAGTVLADRMPLPFPVSAFCRDAGRIVGGRIFAGTAGDGIAEYLGKGPAGIILGRKTPRTRRAGYGPARATRFPAPGGRAHGWFDVSGRLHSR